MAFYQNLLDDKNDHEPSIPPFFLNGIMRFQHIIPRFQIATRVASSIHARFREPDAFGYPCVQMLGSSDAQLPMAVPIIWQWLKIMVPMTHRFLIMFSRKSMNFGG